MDPSNREAVISKIESKWGKGNIHTADVSPTVARVPTGSLEMDYLTGGGYPIGRFIRFFGGASSGKTLASWNAIREAQKLGMDCVYYNIEKQFDPVHVAKIGVDMKKLHVVEGAIIEEIAEKAEALLGVAHVHVFDSCSQAVALDEINSKPSDWHVGLGPRSWRKVFSRLNERFDDNENMVIYIDHARTVFGTGGEAPPGGKAMEHASSMTMHFKRGKWLFYNKAGNLDPDGETPTTLSGDKDPEGIEMQVRCIKSRVCPPFRTARVRIGFNNYEYDLMYEYAKAAKFLGIADSGKQGWYEVDGKKIHGLPKLRKAIFESPDLQEKIKEAMKERA